MPSLRSSASNLARWASAAAFLRAGSCSKYSASFFCLFDGAEATTGKIATRVVVACLLTAHAATRRAELRPETAFASAQAGNQAKGYEGVISIVRSQDRGESGLIWNCTRKGRQAEIIGGREKRVASQEYVMKIFKRGVVRDGEGKGGERRKCRHKDGGCH
jgi:hypothetical protein